MAGSMESRPQRIGDGLGRAEAVPAKLVGTYVPCALQDVAALRAALPAARAEPGRLPDRLARLYGLAHNVAGQGGSFGFPLVGRIGASLCRRLRVPNRLTAAELDIVAAHIDAIALADDSARRVNCPYQRVPNRRSPASPSPGTI